MADKLMIVLLNIDPGDPATIGAPFFQATIAASLEYEVEMIFTGAAGQLLQRGFAENIKLKGSGDLTLYDVVKQAHEAGVTLKICAPASEMWGDNMIAEVAETVGGSYLITTAMSDSTVTFTY